jgi:hypothetical protein
MSETICRCGDRLGMVCNRYRPMRAYWNKIDWRRGLSPPWWRAGHFLLSLAVAIVGLTLSTSAWFAVSLREDQLAALELASRAEGQALNLQVGINSYLRKISGLRALLETFEDNVSRAQFEQFTKQLMNDQNAILGMS